jgi:DNA-binding response OmpR family regulator
VLLADGGKKVLELLDQHDPEMALLDVAMPDFSGLDILKEIRKRGRDFPVVMITA